MTSLEPRWSIVILTAVFGLFAQPLAAFATIYECAGAGGTRIYTDSPAQLKNCTSLGGGTNQGSAMGMPPPASPMPIPGAMSSDPHQGVDLNNAPSYFPGAMVPPPGTPPVADRDIGLPSIPSAPMAVTPGESAPARCSSSINPFNPLMAVPCPSASHAQTAVEGPPPDLPPEPIPSVPPEAMPPQP